MDLLSNLLHSLKSNHQGGLDCRHLITHVQPMCPVYEPVSLTTVCSPHRGSPFMDWCQVRSFSTMSGNSRDLQFRQANIGIGRLRHARDSNEAQHSLPYTLKTPLLLRQISPTSDATHGASIASRLAALPASLTTLILGMVDAPAYSDLTTRFCNEVFNPSTPPRPGIRYFSVGARQEKMR